MSKKRSIWLVVLVLVVVALVGVIAVTTGRGTLGEFSPDTLETRSRREWLFMPTETPLYRSGYDYYQNDLIRYLVDRGYWSPREVSEPRWVSIYRYNACWRDGWSMLQHDVFRHPEKWIAWTEENPRLAAVIWPQVLRVLRDEKYGELSYAEHLLRTAFEEGNLRDYERQMASDIDWPKELPYLPEVGDEEREGI